MNERSAKFTARESIACPVGVRVQAFFDIDGDRCFVSNGIWSGASFVDDDGTTVSDGTFTHWRPLPETP